MPYRLVAIAAMSAAVVSAFMASAFAQGAVPDTAPMPFATENGQVISAAINDICSDKQGTISLLEWAIGGLGIWQGLAALLQNLKNKLPAWALPVVNAIALNFVKAATDAAKAAAVQAPKAAPVLFLALVLSACALTGTAWTPPQQAYFELALATEAENIAYEVETDPATCALAVASLKAGGLALSAGVQANVPVLMNGGSTTTQLEAAGLSAVVPLVNNIGNVVNASPCGAPINVKAAALTVGLDGLQQLPQLIGIVTELNGGYIPSSADITAAQAILAASAAKL